MSFETSPLIKVANKVKNQGIESGNWRFNFEFQILEDAPVFPTAENGALNRRERQGFFKILALINYDVRRPYGSGRKYEHQNAIIAVTPGVWIKFILPNKEFLRLHVTRTRLERRGGDVDVETVSETDVYKPLFRINGQNNTENTPAQALSRVDLDQRGILELDIDLIDPVIEEFRKLLIGGEFWRGHKPNEVLRAYISSQSSQVQVDGEHVMRGMVMEETTMDKKREHIHIPQGTPFLDAIDKIQNDFGIWPSGLSAFLQDRRWYVFPTFNTENAAEQDSGCTIVIVPTKNYQSVERTYLVDGNQLTILASSSNAASNIQQLRFLNEGDGVRFTSAGNMVNGFAEVKDNRLKLSRSQNNTEMQMKDDSNRSHFAPVAYERHTDNNLAQMSRLASRRGIILNFEWQNADHKLILPGMFVTILTLVDDEVVQLYGRILDMNASYQKVDIGPTSKDMTSTISLTLFCNKSEG